MDTPVVGGTPTLQHLVRVAVSRYPTWFVKAARISRYILTNRADVRDQIAMYEHGTRDLYVFVGIGDVLQKAIGHELAHGIDDNFGSPHFFTSTPEWKAIHTEQPYFDIPKYGEEPLEYFADCMTKLFLLGPAKMRTTQPKEVTFITTYVIPVLQEQFGG